MSAGLCLRHVCIRRQGLRLFAPISLTIAPGEVLSLLGESGVGKSSLLAWIAGVLDPALSGEGEAALDEASLLAVPPERRRVGLMFQDDLLFPHMSVGENVAFGLSVDVKGASARRAEVERLLSGVGLSGFGPRDPATLSGGQRARVALVRTLASRPRVLLLDEPFAKLDPRTRAEVRGMALAEARAAKLPTLLVTHDREDREAAGGRALELVGVGDA
jgi:putative thiamine transport system ATP-binding protein